MLTVRPWDESQLIFNYLQQRQKSISRLFFACYLILGLLVVKDYGVNWDDYFSRLNGLTNWNYIFKHDNSLFTSSEKYHGPFIEIGLVGVEKVFRLRDSRAILLGHHVCDFLLFFLASLAFFFSARILFETQLWALTATVMLIITPRIFAESFYNSKDLAFLSIIILWFFSLLKLLNKSSMALLILNSLLAAFAIDVRLLGLLLVPTALVLLLHQALTVPDLRNRYLLFCPFFPLLVFAFVVLFWPVLWTAPFSRFGEAFSEMKKYPWEGHMLYFGRNIYGPLLPWHYLPVSIVITTPLFFVLLWLAGLFYLFQNLLRDYASFFREKFVWLAIAALSFGPVCIVIAMHSVVYDFWRHVYFIYPFILLIATYGLKSLFETLKPNRRKVFAGVFAAYLLSLLGTIIYLHPYENTYFNTLAAVGLKPIEKKFEIDYWGLSYRQGLAYLLKHNPPSAKIKVFAGNRVANANLEILKPKERERFEFVERMDSASYYITNHRQDFNQPRGPIEYEIEKLGYPILTIYRCSN